MNDKQINNLTVDIGYYNHRICTPSWTIEDTVTDFVDVTYVVKGAAEYTINGIEYKVSSGDLLCIQKGVQRSAVAVSENLMECYSVNGYVWQLHPFRETLMPLPIISHIGIQRDIISMYQELNAVWLLRDPGYGLRARAVYMTILQRYFQLFINKGVASTYDNRIKKTLRYIIDHYTEPLTVKDMAEMAGLSTLYFGNFFKKETGLSFRQYLTSIRLNRAEDMLYGGEYNVNEVSKACGFSDVFYFSKVFKENRGITPSQILRSVNGKADDVNIDLT